MIYVAHANTAEELRAELILFFSKISNAHEVRAAVPNMSATVRQSWIVRAALFSAVVELLQKLSIEPKETA